MMALRKLLAGIAAGATFIHACAAVPAAQPGMTYQSLRELPPFAGIWTPLHPPFAQAPTGTVGDPGNAGTQPCVGPPDLVRPEATARCRNALAQVGPGAARRNPYCARSPFTGLMPRGPGGSLEILFTPGQVTISTESGLVRRVYLRNTVPPEALDESFSGTSIGHWEGKTLIVTTTGLDAAANIAFLPGVPIGADARIHERMALLDADTLEIEVTLHAPAVLTAPLSGRQRYQRDRDRLFTPFETCVEGDRSLDLTSGRERFDGTPPADLPPPPQP